MLWQTNNSDERPEPAGTPEFRKLLADVQELTEEEYNEIMDAMGLTEESLQYLSLVGGHISSFLAGVMVTYAFYGGRSPSAE